MEDEVKIDHKATYKALAKAFALQSLELLLAALIAEVIFRLKYNSSITSWVPNQGASELFILIIIPSIILGVFSALAAIRMYLKSNQTFSILPSKGVVIVNGRQMRVKKFQTEETNYFKIGVLGFWNVGKKVIKVNFGWGIPSVLLHEGEFSSLGQEMAAYRKSL